MSKNPRKQVFKKVFTYPLREQRLNAFMNTVHAVNASEHLGMNTLKGLNK